MGLYTRVKAKPETSNLLLQEKPREVSCFVSRPGLALLLHYSNCSHQVKVLWAGAPGSLWLPLCLSSHSHCYYIRDESLKSAGRAETEPVLYYILARTYLIASFLSPTPRYHTTSSRETASYVVDSPRTEHLAVDMRLDSVSDLSFVNETISWIRVASSSRIWI